MSIELTHTVVRKIAKGIRDKYGKEVPHTEVLSIISNAYGYDVGPFMHQLKNTQKELAPKANQVTSLFERDEFLQSLPPILFDNVLSRVVNDAGGIYLFTGSEATPKIETAKAFFKHLVDGFGRHGVTAFVSETSIDEETSRRSSCNLWAFVPKDVSVRDLDSVLQARPKFVLCEQVNDPTTPAYLLELAKVGTIVIAIMTSNDQVQEAWQPFVNALYEANPRDLALVRSDVHFTQKSGDGKSGAKVEYWKIA